MGKRLHLHRKALSMRACVCVCTALLFAQVSWCWSCATFTPVLNMKFQGGASCHEEPSMGQGGGIALVSRIGADACPLTINEQRSRFRKYFDPEEEGAFDSFGSAGGQYNPYQEKTGRDFDLFHLLFSFLFFFIYSNSSTPVEFFLRVNLAWFHRWN